MHALLRLTNPGAVGFMPSTDTITAIQCIYDVWGVQITTTGYSDNQARLN